MADYRLVETVDESSSICQLLSGNFRRDCTREEIAALLEIRDLGSSSLKMLEGEILAVGKPRLSLRARDVEALGSSSAAPRTTMQGAQDPLILLHWSGLRTQNSYAYCIAGR